MAIWLWHSASKRFCQTNHIPLILQSKLVTIFDYDVLIFYRSLYKSQLVSFNQRFHMLWSGMSACAAFPESQMWQNGVAWKMLTTPPMGKAQNNQYEGYTGQQCQLLDQTSGDYMSRIAFTHNERFMSCVIWYILKIKISFEMLPYYDFRFSILITLCKGLE